MTRIRARRWVYMAEVLGEGGAAAGGAADLTGGDAMAAPQGAGDTVGQAGGGGAVGAAEHGQAPTGSGAQAAGNQLDSGAVVDAGAPAGNAQATETADSATLEYTDFSLPAGMTLDPTLLGEFKGVAQGLGLRQEQAQQLTDLGVKLTQGLLLQQAQALETQKTAWKAEVLADVEIGGDKHEAAMALAARAVKQFVPDELKVLFDQTGIGNHPGLVKAFVKIGALLQEDGVVAAGAQMAGTRDAKAMYPNSPELR